MGKLQYREADNPSEWHTSGRQSRIHVSSPPGESTSDEDKRPSKAVKWAAQPQGVCTNGAVGTVGRWTSGVSLKTPQTASRHLLLLERQAACCDVIQGLYSQGLWVLQVGRERMEKAPYLLTTWSSQILSLLAVAPPSCEDVWETCTLNVAIYL
jgi:hypothetical protein